MLKLVEVSRVSDTIIPAERDQSINIAPDNTRVVPNTPFYPVYASPDDVDFQREEGFEAQFLPR